jgi:hypothetical protein
MRVIKQNSPGDPLNQGTVIFHAGANIASRWEDFQNYSEADKDFFDQLLPLENLDFRNSSEFAVAPIPRGPNTVEVREQSNILLEEIPLLENEEVQLAISTLRSFGLTGEQIARAMEEHKPVATTKANERQAARSGLDTRIKNAVGRILGEKNLNHQGRDLDMNRLGKTNFVIVKSAIDKHVNASVGRGTSERHEFTRPELDAIDSRFDVLVAAAKSEVFDG